MFFILISLEKYYDNICVDFNQDRTQCKNANYIQNRTLLNKTTLAIIRNAQEHEIELTGKEPITVKRFMEKFSV